MLHPCFKPSAPARPAWARHLPRRPSTSRRALASSNWRPSVSAGRKTCARSSVKKIFLKNLDKTNSSFFWLFFPSFNHCGEKKRLKTKLEKTNPKNLWLSLKSVKKPKPPATPKKWFSPADPLRSIGKASFVRSQTKKHWNKKNIIITQNPQKEKNKSPPTKQNRKNI